MKTLTFRNEFTSYNWKFSHIPSELFYFCQWPVKPMVFLIYRGLLTIYTMYALTHSIIGFPDPMLPIRSWPVFLTNWSYLILTSYTLCSFVNVLKHYVFVVRKTNSCDLGKSKNKNSIRPGTTKVPGLVKLNWFLFELSSPTALVVSIVYFKDLYPLKKVDYLPIGDVHMHLMNSIIVLTEVAISSIPIRLQHVIYPMLLGAIYSIFTYIYWSLDPPNNVIYQGVVDWGQPIKTLFTCAFLACALLPLMHLLLYILFRSRVLIYQRCCYTKRASR